jgi:ATP-dependent Clp protease adapter protein ClpS
MAKLSAILRPSRGLVLPPDTSLLNMSGMIPANFRCGIEILNDDRTKMEFVVLILMKHFGQLKSDAHRAMLAVHNQGGILLATTGSSDSRAGVSMSRVRIADIGDLNKSASLVVGATPRRSTSSLGSGNAHSP